MPGFSNAWEAPDRSGYDISDMAGYDGLGIYITRYAPDAVAKAVYVLNLVDEHQYLVSYPAMKQATAYFAKKVFNG